MFKTLRNKLSLVDESIVLVSVTPKDCCNIAVYVLSKLGKPTVLMDGQPVRDYSGNGPLNNERLAAAKNFEIRDADAAVLGFHGGPSAMWFNKKYMPLADHCESRQWLDTGG
jgi:hypothetical protein